MAKALVVTPAYCTTKNNRFPLLLQTMYWVLNQTHADLRYVVVDDGSPLETGTYGLLQQLAEVNPNLLIVRQENQGSTSAVNNGIRHGLKHYNADFIGICHSDDLWLPDSLEERVGLMESEGSAFLYSDLVVLDDKMHTAAVQEAYHFGNSKNLFSGLIHRKHNGIPYPTMLWRRDFFEEHVEGYDEDIVSAEDWEIACRTAKLLCNIGEDFSVLSEPTVLYRLHNNNLRRENTFNGRKAQGHKKVLEKNLSGLELYTAKLKDKVRQVAAMVDCTFPSIRNSIRTCRSNPYRGSFLKDMESVDYEQELLSNPAKLAIV